MQHPNTPGVKDRHDKYSPELLAAVTQLNEEVQARQGLESKLSRVVALAESAKRAEAFNGAQVQRGGLTGLADQVTWDPAADERLVTFLDLLEGVADDIERLLGRAAEYEGMAVAGADPRPQAERRVRVEVSPGLRQRLDDGDEPEQICYTDREALDRTLRAPR
jgi:hypothetical protein